MSKEGYALDVKDGSRIGVLESPFLPERCSVEVYTIGGALRYMLRRDGAIVTLFDSPDMTVRYAKSLV
jgi:hypothetical protein